MTDEQIEALIERCWTQLDELTRCGHTTLEGGKVIHADSKEGGMYMSKLVALGRLKPPKSRRMMIPDDFRAPDTRGGDAKSAESVDNTKEASAAATSAQAQYNGAGGEGTQVTPLTMPPVQRRPEAAADNAATINTSPTRSTKKRK